MSGETFRSAVEHAQSQQAKQDYWTRESRIRELIERCSKALGRGGEIADGDPEYYAYVHRKCSVLADLLAEEAGDLHRYSLREAGGAYDYVALRRFVADEPRPVDCATPADRRYVSDVFHALAAIAEDQDIIEDELRNRVDVINWTTKVGIHLQDWDMDIGDPVRGIALDTEALKTLYCGETGDGKSTALEVEAEDFYQANFDDDHGGRGYKLLDLVDLDSGENWFYDIPQQQPALRRIREDEMDLPPDFATSEAHERPEVEIRVPLTPALDRTRLPYDTDSEQFTVRPFTIPASEISKRILIPCILARVSDEQERTIRQAYDDVTGDWSLRDLADEIRARDELSPKHKADAIGVLRSLQDLGFIRTKDHDRTLNWRSIFRDTETITLFSQSMIDEDLGQYLLIAHLVDRILELRNDWSDLPDAVLLMRELWECCPQRGRLSPDERAAAAQETLANRMGKVMRKLRHFDLHLLADTQYPGDLHKQVREMFNRYVVFQGNRDAVDDIFSWTANDRRRSFWGTLNQKKGHAGVVGKVEPAVQEREIEYISPLWFAPPAHHHYDSTRDTYGSRTRVKYLSPTTECPECESDDVERLATGVDVECRDCGAVTHDPSMGREEVLKRPSDIAGDAWASEVPDQLTIEPEDRDGGPDVELSPVAAFVTECLDTADETEYVFKADARAAFNEFLENHDREPWDFSTQSKVTTFGNRLREHFPDGAIESKERTRDGQREYALVGLQFTDGGRRYLKDAVVVR
jgi:hypothetical protein